MSSEDDDEELLQRALAQQQQRDHSASVSALSSAPRRPPPPQRDLTPPASALSSAPRRPPPPIRSAPPPARAPPVLLPMEDEEEEESDVELLSISSDDDSPAAVNRRGSAQQKDAASKARDGIAVEDDSDLEWDDDQEPEKWTSVDQTELVRRVWEMRETRAVNPTTIMRRSTSIVDHGARGEELLDPLGLGVINTKTLTLVRKDQRDSVSQTGKGGSGSEKDARSEEAQGDSPIVRDPAAKEKVMYHSENFNPKLFLARIHRNTGASDLEAGEGALKMDLQNRKSQLKKLVKENFDCFISCKNTIDDIHSKLQQIEADPEGAGTVHLSNSIQSVDVSAKRAFGPLLERQAQAERIRSVQGMLQRFRTLFNLPSIIRAHISKGEYDMAIREYKKAKSLVQYTHVGILSRVLEEVDKIVQEFKDMLYKTMENPNVETSQLENTIRLLLELEPDSDPVWYYLSIQDRRIRGLLEGCSLEHEARMDALHARVQEKVLSDARWKQLQRESNKGSDVDFHLLLGDQDKETGEDGQLKQSIGEESDALLGRLIRRLTVVLVQHVPNLWHLALLIFSGKFVKVSQPGSANGHRQSFSNEASMYPFENHSPGLKYTRHSMDEVLTMVHCIISLYETKVQNAFIALAEANVFRPYMREALSEIASACVALQGKDCAPASAVQSLLVLRSEVTRVFVLRLCTLIRGATSELIYKEDWVPVSTTERGDTPFAISHLPLRFRNMLEGTMEHMSEMIQKLTSESVELPEDLTYQVHQMQDNVRSTFVECFLEFAECLDKLAVPSAEVTYQYQRLLVVLSNTAFCKNSLLPSLSHKYQPIWTYSNRPAKGEADLEDSHISTTEEAFDAFLSLEEKILSQYNRAKAVEVGIAAAAYLLDDGTQWGQTPAIKGIRDNVVELMHPLVTVHAEVYAGAKPFLDKVISSLVECLITALFNVFTENKHKLLRILDVNGYCQLTLEMDFIDAVLERFFTVAAREAALGLRDMLLDKVCESAREIHMVENVGSMSMRARAGDHAMISDGASPISPDEIQARANQISADFLPAELRRARMNVVCFMESLSESNLVGRRVSNLPKTGLGRHSSLTSINRHFRKSSGSILGSSGSLVG